MKQGRNVKRKVRLCKRKEEVREGRERVDSKDKVDGQARDGRDGHVNDGKETVYQGEEGEKVVSFICADEEAYLGVEDNDSNLKSVQSLAHPQQESEQHVQGTIVVAFVLPYARNVVETRPAERARGCLHVHHALSMKNVSAGKDDVRHTDVEKRGEADAALRVLQSTSELGVVRVFSSSLRHFFSQDSQKNIFFQVHELENDLKGEALRPDREHGVALHRGDGQSVGSRLHTRASREWTSLPTYGSMRIWSRG